MNQDFVTRLQLQLREAALREERRTSVARRLTRARWQLPGPAPVAAALAAVLLALAVALGAVALRGEPEPAAPKVIKSFRVADGLSSLAPGFGAVWTADPNRGEILRIDTTTRGIVARIPVRGDARVAVGAGAVWALAGDLLYAGDQGPVRLLRIDPSTNRVVARIPMVTPDGHGFGPVELQIEDGLVWVVGQSGALRIDPGRNAPDRFVSFAREAARGAVAEGGRIWELSVDGRLRQFDVRTGQTVSEVGVRVPADSHLFPSGPDTLTLIGDNRIALLDRSSGRELWHATLAGEIRSWIPDGDSLWAHASRDSAGRDRLVRLDAGSGRVRGQVELPEPGVAGIARVGRDVWVATPGGKIVVVR